MLFRSQLEQRIYDHVKSCGEDHCSCGNMLPDIDEDEVLGAAEDLVKRGILIGGFPPNPNRKYGIDWGYLAIPRPSPAQPVWP